MKTLHLTNSWHSSSGGIGTFYKALFETACRERHQIRLVVPGERDHVEEVGEFGRIYHVRAPRAPVSPEYRIIYPNRFLFPGTAIQRILNAEQPDLVEASEKYTAPYLAGLLRTRRLPGVRFRPTLVGTSHERMDENMSAYFSAHPLALGFCRAYMKIIYFSGFDHHIAVSEHTAGELIDASRGHKVRRGIWVSPMGVDADLFTPAHKSPEGRRRLEQMAGANPGDTILLYAGRLAPEKNLGLLLDTMACLRLPACRLVIAGQGILLDSLRAECERRGLSNITFPGHVKDRGTLAGHYANADVFIHPNPREPFGIAPLEAMAAGVALVAPDRGGLMSYANSGNAWLAAPSAPDFAAAINAVLENPAERSRRTARARLTAEEHAWPLVTTRYLRLCHQLHALTCGSETSPAIAPRVWSTPGDALGRELIEL